MFLLPQVFMALSLIHAELTARAWQTNTHEHAGEFTAPRTPVLISTEGFTGFACADVFTCFK